MRKTVGNDVKFAGEDHKAKIYEPKQNKKLIRLLTVMGYVFSVSLVAIMLSLYYVFLWDPNLKGHRSAKPLLANHTTPHQQEKSPEVSSLSINNIPATEILGNAVGSQPIRKAGERNHRHERKSVEIIASDSFASQNVSSLWRNGSSTPGDS